MYNILYRLGLIYYNTYLIDASVKEFLEDFSDDSEETEDDKDITEYVSEAKQIGSLVGDQFKYFFSIEKQENEEILW